jgi:hypothetical protein
MMLGAAADGILRRARWTTSPGESRAALLRLGMCLATFALVYGGVMGTFRGLTGQDQWLLQVVYSALKVPILLTGSFALGLPSFFVLSTLSGLRQDFGESVRALAAGQAGMAIVLASLSPLTLLWYASSSDYHEALAFNGLMFLTASLVAQYLLRAYYRPLVARHPRHRTLLIAWAAIYLFVAIQLAWLLRPFIGSAAMEVQFLRPEAWGNAYVFVARLVRNILAG